MKDSTNKSTCMWARQFVGWANVRAKQFHACDNSEMETKIETDLGQASICVNDSKPSKKSNKNTPTSENTKSNRNAARGMGSGLAPK